MRGSISENKNQIDLIHQTILVTDKNCDSFSKYTVIYTCYPNSFINPVLLRRLRLFIVSVGDILLSSCCQGVQIERSTNTKYVNHMYLIPLYIDVISEFKMVFIDQKCKKDWSIVLVRVLFAIWLSLWDYSISLFRVVKS